MAQPAIASFLALSATVLPQIKDIKSIDAGKNLHDALKVFAESRVYALPVMKSGHYVGLVTIKSVVKHLLEEFYHVAGAQGKAAKDKENAATNHKFGDHDIQTIVKNFSQRHIGDIVDITSKPLTESATVHDVVQALQTVDRVPVADKNGHLVQIYSQSGVIKYFTQHLESLGTLADKEIGSIANFITKPVKVVDGSVRALAALSIMTEENFSSLGFTNEDKNVEGVVSFKDIRAAADNLSLLVNNSVADYVNEIRRTDTENLLRDVVPTVNCSTADSLKKVIGKLNAVGIHRLFVREKEERGNHFIGIVTLSDVLKLILRSA